MRFYPGGSAVIRWNARLVRVAMVLGAFAALAIDAGAGLRW
jgi:hypothetical protein